MGLIVAGCGLLQGGGRPSSTFGVATFAASWSVIVILWLGAIILGQNQLPHSLFFLLQRGKGLLALSLIALTIFLILTQARGAALGLFAGLLAAAFLWAITHRQRWLELTLLSATVLLLLAGMGLYTGVYTIDRRLPLIGRFDMSGDQSGKFRLLLWQSIGQVVSDWPTMISVSGTPDSLSPFRPIIGYGQEMLADIMRPRLSADLRATFPDYQFVDRAHNLWLDTLLTQGWFGLSSLIGVYLAAGWTCLKILRQQGRVWGGRGWLAAGSLAILVAHVVDLQFSFPSVASGWPFWVIVGVVYAESLRRPTSRRLPMAASAHQHTILLPLLSALVAWPIQITLAYRPPTSTLIMIGLLALVALIVTRKWRAALLSALTAALAILIQANLNESIRVSLANTQSPIAFLLLVAYHIMVLVGIGLVIGLGMWSTRRRLFQPPQKTFMLVLIILVGFGASLWWILDATADSVFLVASQQPALARANFYQAALRLKAPDDRLTRLTVETINLAIPAVPADQREEWAARAHDLTSQANALNPYATDLGGSNQE